MSRSSSSARVPDARYYFWECSFFPLKFCLPEIHPRFSGATKKPCTRTSARSSATAAEVGKFFDIVEGKEESLENEAVMWEAAKKKARIT